MEECSGFAAAHAGSQLSLGRGLRQWGPLQGVGQHLIHVGHRDEVQRVADGLVDLFQIGLVVLGDDDSVDAVAQGGHGLLP